MKSLFRRKSLDRLLAEREAPEGQLKRSLGVGHLTAMGVGAIVGAGIFSTVGTAAAGGSGHIGAGPSLILSFLLVAVVCGFAGLCYAEFAAMVPVAGSAYTYTYASLGELAAWIIGWDLILEYAVGNVAVAISWSGYFQELLRGIGLNWPLWLGTDYRSALQAAREVAAATEPASLAPSLKAAAQAWVDAPRLGPLRLVFNLPAFGIVILLTWLLARGVKESARANTVMVLIKLGFLVFFLAVGIFYIEPSNWQPFAPNGVSGIFSAAAIIFFAYIGFDAVSTAAEETQRPQRDLPAAILASLVICTVLYAAVALVLTGMAPWDKLGTAEPLATAFSTRGLSAAAGIISAGALVATTSVLLVFQYGQVRIFFAMARDGLLPGWAARVHPRYRTPYLNTWITGLAVALFAGWANINEVVELCNIGTLFAFILVAFGVILLRRRHPEWPRPFRVPWFPWVPLAAIFTSTFLMAHLPLITWISFAIWLVAGLTIYFFYSRRHSRFVKEYEAGDQPR